MNSSSTMGFPINAGGLTVTYSGTAGTLASAVGATTTAVRIVSTTDCFIEISVAGTAAVANTGMFLPAMSPEYFPCLPGSKVSAIRLSADGSIYVSQMS